MRAPLLLLALALPACSRADAAWWPPRGGPGPAYQPDGGTTVGASYNWTFQQQKAQAPSAAVATSSGTVVSETFTSTPTTGALVIAQVAEFNGGGSDLLTSVTDNQGGGNTYTIIRRFNGNLTAALAYCFLSTASGTFTVTANFSSPSASIAYVIAIAEYRSSGSTPSFDTSTTGAASTASMPLGTVTPAGPNRLFVSVWNNDGGTGPTFTVPAGWTELGRQWNGGSFTDFGSGYFIAANSNAQTATWTSTGGAAWVGVHAAFKP